MPHALGMPVAAGIPQTNPPMFGMVVVYQTAYQQPVKLVCHHEVYHCRGMYKTHPLNLLREGAVQGELC